MTGVPPDQSTVLDEVLREIRRTTRIFPLPAPQFDPQWERADLVHALGLPSMPDAGAQPELFAFLNRLYAKPLRFIEADFTFADPHYTLDPRGGLPAPITPFERSRNWSGASIMPSDGRVFTQLHGSWQVPTSAVPVTSSGGAPTPASVRSSSWIGLDGQRAYLNSTLPQIGTSQFMNIGPGGKPVAKANAWWQWWANGLHRPPLTLRLDVSPGDEVMCVLTVIDPTHVRMLIKNQTTGHVMMPFDALAPAASMNHPPSPIQTTVSGATAEWVMERPSIFPTDDMYDLPDYGTLVFHDCFVLTDTVPASSSKVHRLEGAQLLSMFEVRSQPRRTALISVPKRLSETCVMMVHR